MSASLNLDPSKGFVALPLSVMSIDMSPGAFRALAELCRMANPEGWCWPSLGQLSERLGRSRAAISGYVQELRALDLIETQTQRTANGYNSRLKYRVTFWADWRARFGKTSPAPAVSKTERSVRPAERKSKALNHNHKNQPRPAAVTARSDLSGLVSAWKACAGSAPYPAFERAPSPSLIDRTAALGSGPMSGTSQQSLKQAIEDWVAQSGLAAEDDWIGQIAPILSPLQSLPAAETLLAVSLKAQWKPHWKRLPAPTWMRHLVQEICANNPEALQRRILLGYLRRATRSNVDIRGADARISTEVAA